MGTRQATVDFILGQISAAGNVAAKKMFGEYAIYCDDKIVALVCDDQLFLKPTSSARALLGDVIEAPPYEGAKPSLLISPDRWEDHEWMTQLIRVSTAELPAPKPKTRNKAPRL